MTEKRSFVLGAHPEARQRAIEAVRSAPDGACVKIGPAVKKREQEEKYHAMIGDIARQVEYAGRKWDADDMKRLLVDEFSEEMRQAGTPLHHDSRVVPSFDGRRIVQLGIQTRQFRVAEASAFIEYLFAFGSNHSVNWSA